MLPELVFGKYKVLCNDMKARPLLQMVTDALCVVMPWAEGCPGAGKLATDGEE